MGLIAHYPLNGDLLDYSGNNRDATGENLTTSTSGKIGSCYEFNGDENKRIYITNFPENKIKLSWAIWLYKTSDTDNQHFISQGRDVTAYGVAITSNSGTNIRIFFGTTIHTVTYTLLNKWTHITLTANGSIVKVYLNGIYNSQFTQTAVDYSQALNGALVIGKMSYGYTATTSYFGARAKINDVRIYDHALSTKEIQEVAKAKVLHYTFNQFEEPTTNEINNGNFDNGQTNWGITLATGGDWLRSATYKNDSFPYINIHWERVAGSGNSWSSMYNIYTTNSTTVGTYTLSCKIRINAFSGSTAIIRHAALGNDYDTSGLVTWSFSGKELGIWHEVELTRTFVATYTHGGTPNIPISLRFELYSGSMDIVGEFVDFDLTDVMIDFKDHATPFALTSRTGTVRDMSGYGNDAPLTTALTPEWISDSKLGDGGYIFNTVVSPTTIHKSIVSSNTDISAFTEFTYAGWVKTSYNSFLVMGCQNGNNTYLSMAIISGKLTLHKYFYNSSVDTNIAPSTTTITDNTWRHCAITYKNGLTKVYVDGIEENSATHVNSTSVNNSFRLNFSSAGLAGRNFDGSMDDVRVYATELSSDAILELAQTRAQLDDTGNLFLNELDIYQMYDIDQGTNNLILNGDLGLVDNTNFTNTVYDGTNSAFSLTSTSVDFKSSEYIEYKGNGLDSWDEYYIEMMAKGVDYTSKYYLYLAFYDKNKRFIYHWDIAHYTNTYTTLSQALTSGDDWVYLSDTTNWFDAGTNLYDHRQSLSMWLDGTDEYAPFTYSVRHQSITDVDKTNDRILLQTTYSGPTIPIGSSVCNSYAGSTYSYIGAINKATNLTTWEVSSGTVATTPNTMMRYGTKYARIGFLMNRDAIGGTPTTLFKNLKLINKTSGQGTYFTSDISKLTDSGVYDLNGLSEIGITDGLEGYWKLNGDALDYSGNGYDGTVNGAVVSGGLKDLAYDFDGVNDKIRVPIVYPTTWTDPYSISTWINIPTSATWSNGFDGFVVTRASYGGSHGIYRDTTNNVIGVVHRTDSGMYAVQTTITRDVWYNISYTYDGILLSLYKDGVFINSITPVQSGIPDQLTWTLGGVGALAGNVGNYYEGKIGDTRMYNRALSDEEILILYKHGLTNTGMQLSKDGTLYTNREINEGL